MILIILLVNWLRSTIRKWCLCINMERTEYLMAEVTKRELKQGALKIVDFYKYLGVTISRSDTGDTIGRTKQIGYWRMDAAVG